MTFFSGLWTVAAIELRQRVRGVAWYVLLGLFVLLTLLVSAILTLTYSYTGNAGSPLYSTIIYFILLLASLVTPALGGNSINGDRDTGTLATTQVTLISTPQLVLGKFLAAWISSLAFLAAGVPFILYSFVIGGTSPATVIVSILVLAAELAVLAAVGVGLSGILRRPLFSIVVTYLVVAMLSVGTLIGFTLGGIALQTHVTVHTQNYDYSDPNLQYDDNGNPIGAPCVDDTYETTIPRFDLVWWMLAANPYVVLADAAPTQLDPSGQYPVDLFGTIKLGVRGAQLTPDLLGHNSYCGTSSDFVNSSPSAREIIDSTTPGWLVGLLIDLGLAVAALWGAIALTRAPSKRLAAGSRIA